MKHFLTVCFVILAMLLPAFPAMGQGQLLLQETFNTPVNDLSASTGWATLAAGTIGSTTAPPYIVVNAGSALSYTGYIESGNGNSAYLAGAGQDAQITTGTLTSGIVYLAFMMRVDSAYAAGDYVWMVRNSSNHNRWRMWIKSTNAGANYELGVSKTSTNPTTYTSKNLVFGTTYLVVSKYNWNTPGGTDATLSLWVNPSASSFGAATEDASPAITNANDGGTNFPASPGINRFALIMNGVGTAPDWAIGGVRMGTDWKTVLPPPPMYYNFSGTGDVTNPANWGTNLDGTGTAPTDFASNNQLYLIRNATPSIIKTVTVSNALGWTITGNGSKVIVGAGINLILGGGSYIAGTVDVSSGSTLTIQAQDNLNWPTFGNMAGTVAFDNPAGFTLTGDQVLPQSTGSYVLNNSNMNVASFTLRVRGKLKPNSYQVAGSGKFILDSAATLYISSTAGITTSGATGDIQSTTRQFSRYGNYEYVGQSNQITGNGLPDTVSNLTVTMASRNLTTSLSKAVVSTGNLGMNVGKFRLGGYNLTFSNPVGHSDSSYVITDSAGALVRPVVNTGKKTMPVGSATELRQIAVTFEATPTANRNLGFRYISGDTASVGFPKGITYRYKGGYWNITSDSSTNPTYRLDVNVPLGFADTTILRLIRRVDPTVAWDTVGTVGGYSAGVLNQAGIAVLGQFSIGVGASAPPPPPGKRYQSEVFSSYQLQSNIQYGQAGSTALYLDLFSGTGDVEKKRPLILFIHGGGFQGGDKVSNFGSLFCGGLAKRGYAVASINYRITSPIANDTVHFESMLRALQDAKAAIRFFRKNGTLYNVDTSQIFATGSSAGSITALHLAYLDSSEVPQYVTWSNVGGTFEGTSGNPGFSSRIQAVVSNWGAIGDTAWIKKGNIPVYCIHGTSDSTVFYDQIPADGPFRYSDKYIYATAQQKGIASGLRLFYNTGHTLDNNSTKQDSAYKDAGAWLYTILNPNTSAVQEVSAIVPTSIALQQNYPNPFNPATTIRFQIPSAMRVSVSVFNLLGQKVASLVDEMTTPGSYAVSFDASKLASGVYLYQLRAGATIHTKKMVLMK